MGLGRDLEEEVVVKDQVKEAVRGLVRSVVLVVGMVSVEVGKQKLLLEVLLVLLVG